ncbi:hypothetical protein LTR78_008167 [Recurvomyces mirabilis]|uniref:Uncharacterized protein n=1 Tax=Recurvomyces mirabilis TaxID=574656 RepID=A0AAE0TQP3_9PEZI|nr:hypothetical protein LTR78_008167 [Recurvomyces mirabilis]KAK5150634.1 hypothetical protein LTS14_009917 [Recurvomyces mirabilis]
MSKSASDLASTSATSSDSPHEMGSKTSRGGVHQARTKPTPSREQQEERVNSTKQADETVEVYSDGNLVGTVSRRVLVRFSKAASVAFPKPAGKETGKHANEKLPDADPTLWSTAYVKKAANEKDTTKIRLVLENVQRQPSEEALRQVLRWMVINKDVHGNEEFLPFFTDTAADLPLSVLLDLYGATLAFHLRPAPHALREHLSKVILHTKPSTNNIETVHNRVPTNEGLHKWMITAYYRWCEDGDLSDDEIQVIQDYVYENSDLTNLFLDVEETRRQRKEEHKERNAAKTKARAKAAKDLQDGWKAMAAGGSVDESSKSSPVVAAGNGKGVDDKHVPGASSRYHEACVGRYHEACVGH